MCLSYDGIVKEKIPGSSLAGDRGGKLGALASIFHP